MQYYIYDYIKSRHYDELKDKPTCIREAMLFRYEAMEMEIFLDETDEIAGRYGFATMPAYENDRHFPYHDVYTPEQRTLRQDMDRVMQLRSWPAKGHTCIDYGRILREGTDSYAATIRQRLTDPTLDTDGKTYLQAMLIALEAVSIWSSRFAALYREKCDQVSPEARPRYARICQALERVPMQPARDFLEATQALWLLHSLVPLSERSWASISIGRFDQFMYPYWERADVAEKERIPAYICSLFRLLDSYGDGACALNLGGMDAEDHDQMNDLSRVILQAEKDAHRRSPIITARITPDTPDDIWDALLDETLFTMGQPTFYGEVNCRRAMEYRGVPHGDACGFSVNSCMGLVVAGQEIADMWGCMFNMHAPLELTVNHGAFFAGPSPLPLHTAPRTPQNLEELLATYRSYLQELLAVAVTFNELEAQNVAVNEPNPFLSVFTEDCIRLAKDRIDGCRYRTATMEGMALTNTADAICAIDTLVFREGKYTIDELVNAALGNYENCGTIRRDILSCPKYGTGDPYADRITATLFDYVAELLKPMDTGNRRYAGSLHTIDTNVGYGAGLGATLDGRLAHTPINKNAGPSLQVLTKEPTSLVLSAGKMPQYKFSGGQPIDLHFDVDVVRHQPQRIRELIQIYFQSGGLQFQVNSVDADTLRKAMAEPENYRDLIVRIGGYSGYFNDLAHGTKLELIERFDK